MKSFLFNLLGNLSGTSGTAVASPNLIASLEILWKGMLGIFVVIALIFVAVKIMNVATTKKKDKKDE